MWGHLNERTPLAPLYENTKEELLPIKLIPAHMALLLIPAMV